MPLAASTYTFGDGLLTVLEIAFLFLWIWIAIGVVGYLIVRGHTLHEHQAQDRAQYEAFRQFTRGPSSGGTADDLHRLADLKDRGVLTDEEFERAKAKVLG